MSEGNGRREHLEACATELRSALSRRLDVIDQRRQRVTEVARDLAGPVKVVAAVALVIAAGAIIVGRLRARRSPQRGVSQLLGAPQQRKSVWVRGLERAAVSLIAVTAQRFGARGLDQLLGAAPLRPVMAVPRPRGTRERTVS
jgi:hypothetical protein